MSNKVCFITRNFGKYDPDSLQSYESIGGFTALRKALKMDGNEIADVLAANRVNAEGSGFGSPTNAMAVVSRTGREEAWPVQSKMDVAWDLCSWLLQS